MGNTVSVLLGNGDGTFSTQETIPVPPGPTAVAVADVNGDGRPDLVVTSYQPGSGQDGSVSVLLGNGDGTFQPPSAEDTFTVGHGPSDLAVADLTGDGIPDLIVTNRYDNTVSVLLGNGDGTFQPARTFAAGAGPVTVAVADFNGDGIPDLVIADAGGRYSPANTLTLLLGNGQRGEGDGTFAVQPPITVGTRPSAVAVANLTGDGIPDLVVANAYDNTVSVLLGNGNGTFDALPPIAVGMRPVALAVADVNGDGIPDVIVANNYDNTVSVLLGQGDGTFLPQQTFAVGVAPVALAAADLNGDGKTDLVTANYGDNTVSVLLGKGDGTFLPATVASGVGERNTPFQVDLNNDGIPDSVILDHSGNILFRQGLSGADQSFAPPQIINASVFNPQTQSDEELTARDLTILNSASGPAIATADAIPAPNVLNADHQFAYTVSLYTFTDGSFARTTAFSTSLLPTSITAGDLTGNGLDDIVVADALDNSIQIAFQQPDGTFSSPITLPVGIAPSGVILTDVNGDGLLDVVVSDQASGDVSVLMNQGNGSFAPSVLFRAGIGLFGLDAASPTAQVSSLVQSISLAAGDFTGDGRNDLVIVDDGTHSFSVLQNDGNGGFSDPQATLTTSTSDSLALAAMLHDSNSNGVNASPARSSPAISTVRTSRSTWPSSCSTRPRSGSSPATVTAISPTPKPLPPAPRPPD